MAQFFSFDLPYHRRKGSRHFLAFFWLAGLLCGMCAWFGAGGHLVALMRGSVLGSVSIIGSLCVSVLPFLFSAFAVFICRPWLLLILSFLEAFVLTFVGLGIMGAFGSAGWLIRWLLCFGSCFSAPMLYLYWLRHISGGRRFRFSEAALGFSLEMLIGSIDYCLIAPFLAHLISN